MPVTLFSRRLVPLAPAAIGICGLGWLVTLSVACSVDVGKLRASKAQDGPADVGGEPDTVLVFPEDAKPADDLAPEAPDLLAADPDAASDGTADLPSEDGPGDIADVQADAGDVGMSDDADAELGGDDSGAGGVGGAGGAGGTAGSAGGSDGGDARGTGGWGHGGRGGTAGVSGTGGTGTGGTGMGGAGDDPDLVLHYAFDESSGTIASDSATASTGPHNGTLATYGTYGMSGSAVFSSDSRVGARALLLTPSTYGPTYGGGYVTVPALQTLAPEALTIAVWVKLASTSYAQNWERVFDFGSGTTSAGGYFYMTARAEDAMVGIPVRFGISKVGRPGAGAANLSEQRLEGTTTLTANVWYHLAVVLPAGSPYTGTLYIDGAVADTNDEMTAHLSDLGITSNNWLGRSQFTNDDPFFHGALDDLRVYRRALSQEEISALIELR